MESVREFSDTERLDWLEDFVQRGSIGLVQDADGKLRLILYPVRNQPYIIEEKASIRRLLDRALTAGL